MFNRTNRKNKLLKLLLILPLFIALTIFCYATFIEKHEKNITNTLFVPLPVEKLTENENVEYFNVNLTKDVCNQENNFSILDHPSDIEQIEIPITNKTYILKTIPKIANSTIKRQYEVFLDDRVYSRGEDIKVSITKAYLNKILYKEKSDSEIKEIILSNPNDASFLSNYKIFSDEKGQKNNNIILKASRKPEDTNSRNPRLKLDIEHILDYQKMKAIPEIKELIQHNVESITLEVLFIIATEENNSKN